MPIDAEFAGAAALLASLVALAVYHFTVVRPQAARLGSILDAHDALLGGGAGAAGRLAAIEAAQRRIAQGEDAIAVRLAALETLAATDVSRVGFVRYNALGDTGSDLSYALALLNREGDGVVLSSIYTRSDTRTYGKAVRGFTPVAAASQEEISAVERARSAPPASL